MIFDGRSEDFATEMFVIINSTPTRINKSHLVDLYERVSFAAPDRRFAARLVERLYSEGDSPLRYRINRLVITSYSIHYTKLYETGWAGRIPAVVG